MEKDNLYERISFDFDSAKKFKRKVLGLFGDIKIKSLEELSEIFPKINKKYTKKDGKGFILDLCNTNKFWQYNSAEKYNYFLSFNDLRDGDIVIKKRKDYTNEGD